ncbi:TetR/AcrR family transcriptional regulator [Micromonospora zamorensis]|uniref:TetR/AcrR family transcriptional regulator n=1 Tax=Micromonospora zamorensis TaxID=709883 RepID=UPI003CF504F6
MTDDERLTASAQATRTRIIEAAGRLLAESGRDAVTNRSVSAAAGVQPPAIYRLFGDKDGLLDAVATHGLRNYLADKGALPETDDVIADLTHAWDLHIAFGLAEPAFYLLAFGDSEPGRAFAARTEAVSRLRRMVERVAAAGRLRTSVERATAVMHAGGVGVVITQLALAPDVRDPALPGVVWEMVRRSILDDGERAERRSESIEESALAQQANVLQQALRTAPASALTDAERTLLIEWLTRLADAHP